MELKQNQVIARVIEVHRDHYECLIDDEVLDAKVSGRFRYTHQTSEFPIVGDWVVCIGTNDLLLIERIKERTSYLSRASSHTQLIEQPMVANVDVVCLVIACNKDFNEKKLIHNMIQLKSHQYELHILLSKMDLHPDPFELKTILINKLQIPVHCISKDSRMSIEQLRRDVFQGKTTVLVGSSGVGKSTLVNLLLEEETQITQTISERLQEGQHTTTRRTMFKLDEQSYLIDMPGMRVLNAYAHGLNDNSLSHLTSKCKFSDCDHQTTKRCAVLVALENHEITQEQYQLFIQTIRHEHFIKKKESIKARMKRGN